MATLCLGLAGPAIAQTGAAWQPFEESWTGFRGGRLCTSGAGDETCLTIGCAPDDLGYVRITVPGDALPPRLTVELRNGPSSLMREEAWLHTDESGEMQGDYWMALPAEWGMDVVALLRQGVSGVLVLERSQEDGSTVTVPLDLTGADAALAPVAACRIRAIGEPDPMAFNG